MATRNPRSISLLAVTAGLFTNLVFACGEVPNSEHNSADAGTEIPECETNADCADLESDDMQFLCVEHSCLPRGPQGPKGDDGEQGATGPQGPQGPAGHDGRNADAGTSEPDAKPEEQADAGSSEDAATDVDANRQICDGDWDHVPNNPQFCDLDGDGYFGDVDCDDHDSAVHPGAIEDPDTMCGDGVDQDCNGQDLACVLADTGHTFTVWCRQDCEAHIFHWAARPGDDTSFGVSLASGNGFSVHLTQEESCGQPDGVEVKTRPYINGRAQGWYGDPGAPAMDGNVRISVDDTIVHDLDLNPRLQRIAVLGTTNAEGNYHIPNSTVGCP